MPIPRPYPWTSAAIEVQAYDERPVSRANIVPGGSTAHLVHDMKRSLRRSRGRLQLCEMPARRLFSVRRTQKNDEHPGRFAGPSHRDLCWR